MAKSFFWRTVICLVPLLAAGYVTAVAWRNYEDPSATGPRFNLGVDLAGGTVLVYEVDETGSKKEGFTSADLAAALKRRIDPSNLMEITIRPIETTPARVEIILPMRSGKAVAKGDETQGEAGIERVKRIIRQVGKLEFRILADTRADANGDSDAAAINDARALLAKPETITDLNHLPAPEGYQWLELDPKEVAEKGFNQNTPEGFGQDGPTAFYHASKATTPGTPVQAGRHFVLTRVPPPDAVVTGEDLAGARPSIDNNGRWVALFSLSGQGGDRMARLTTPHVGHFMATILDNKVQSYANIRSALRDSIEVQMGGAGKDVKKKVDDLVLILRAGALPATLKPDPVSELTMGPGLGQDTIEKGTSAVAWAFVAVVVFMILYYRFAGFVASTALLANLLLTIGFMVAVKAAFTLPGLAGLVLMLGMAVDANVLIYERIREERERGAGLALAIRNGYDRAFPTIIDTHLTSIFTAIVLYMVGNDQLKGFGISLTVGLIISLFTALYMTRLIFDFFLDRGWLKKLSMFKLLSKTRIDFMTYRYYFFAATVLFSLFGLVVFLARGEAGLNIDFTGGTAYSVEFQQPKRIDEVREAINRSGLPDPTVDAIYAGDAVGAGETKFFTFRTTLKNRDQVRRQVETTFGKQLAYVEVRADPIQAIKGTKFDKQAVFHFANKRVSRAELQRVVGDWLAGTKKVVRPDDHFTVLEEGGDAAGLYDKLILQFTLPDELAGKEQELVAAVLAAMNQPKSDKLENFDSQLAAETQGKAFAAIGLSWLAITLYLWFRFGNWTFGLAAVLCLIHDLMFTIGLIGISHYLIGTGLDRILLLEDFKLDLPAVAALLTLVGYSVNDTIVVFDRIREVRGKNPDLTPQIINDSINQTLSRTILTSVIVFLVVFVLYVMGGEGVHLFSFVMVVGVIVGTYSSIYVASPLLLMLGEGRHREPVRSRKEPQEAGV